MNLPILSPSDFVAIFNQTLEIAYPVICIEGEISNFKIAKKKWVYFDIKDDTASLRCFASVFNLRMPLRDGMTVTMTAHPQLHPLYNLSLNVIDVTPLGEGSIKKAADLLKLQLEKEGLFLESRKRQLPYPPERVGLITSSESAAYGDFLTIIKKRWPTVSIFLRDTKVQGVDAANEVVQAVHAFNQSNDVDVLVIIRGGGSADDLLAFQEEKMVRTIAESRIPTLVAIGHEKDYSLAELAADLRASTPSNAAELLVPTKDDVSVMLRERLGTIGQRNLHFLIEERSEVKNGRNLVSQKVNQTLLKEKVFIESMRNLLAVVDPTAILRRGYSIVRNAEGEIVSRKENVRLDDVIRIQFSDGETNARVVG